MKRGRWGFTRMIFAGLTALAVMASLAVPCGAALAETPPDDLTAETPAEMPPDELTAGALLQQMTLREKVGQLFVIRPEQLSVNAKGSRVSGGTKNVNAAMTEAYARYPVGGFALFKQNITSPAQLTQFMADLRGLCRIAPVLTVDEEGGSVTRIGGRSVFGIKKAPSMRRIGKTGDPQNAFDAAEGIGSYLAEYGFTLDLAPVADVLTNPKNSVIGSRSFGSDPRLVSDMVAAYVDGLHANGVAACLKHFPGHGGTSGDTHSGRVSLNRTWDELLTAELVPFIENLDSAEVIMVAHITLPKVTDDGLPASLSRELITDRLRGDLGFRGVVTTDALEMSAISGRYKPAEAAVLAIDAGIDMLLMPSNLVAAFEGVVDAVNDGRLSEARIDESVLRILRLKLGEAQP